MYVFCYGFGYIVTITDPALSVVSCVCTFNELSVDEITDMPDVILGEMLMNGSIVFISTLYLSEKPAMSMNAHVNRPVITGQRPIMIYRKWWDKQPTKL